MRSSGSYRVGLSEKIALTLRAYMRSQFVFMILVAVVYACIFSLLRVKYAILLGVMTGAFSTIPLLGMMTASLFASVVATFDNARFFPQFPEIIEGLAVLGLYFGLNFLTDTFLSPYLTSRVISVHPLVIFVSVIIGSTLFGIVGAFFAVPIVLIAYTIYMHYYHETSA